MTKKIASASAERIASADAKKVVNALVMKNVVVVTKNANHVAVNSQNILNVHMQGEST